MTTEKKITLVMSEKEAKSLERVLEALWLRTNWDPDKKTYTGEVSIKDEEHEFIVTAKKIVGKEVQSC